VQVHVLHHTVTFHHSPHLFPFWKQTQHSSNIHLLSALTMANKNKQGATRSKQAPVRAATGKAAKASVPEAPRPTRATKEPISVDSDEEIEDVTPSDEQTPPTDDEQRREEPQTTNDFINDINNPNGDESTPADSPSKSPVKKKSKKEALAGLFTNLPVTAKSTNQPAKDPTPTPKTTPTSSNTTTAKKPAEKRPASSLKEPKYSGKTAETSGSTVKVTPLPAKKPHVHKFQRTVVEGAIDFSKDQLQQYAPNRCKMLVQAITYLTKQMSMVDSNFVINHKDPTETMAIGQGQRVPDNMTNLCNYILRLNPNHLKEPTRGGGGGDGDALDSIHPSEKKGNRSSPQTCYFTLFL
jgi:hypothetical protein